jgi:methylenetetrahydrofolate reductase (NADPH)
MMRFTELVRTAKKPVIGLEFFPPKNPKLAETLDESIRRLSALNPDFATVTFGAGGSTREGSRELAEKLHRGCGLELVAYFAGFGLGPGEIDSVMAGYRGIGVENILVVRGDPPRDPDFRPHPGSLAYASDLLDYIRPRHDFCLGAAGYPEGHVHSENKDRDADFLRLKVDRGAEFILTNYFYDNRYFFEYLERCRKRGVTVPIIPGVLPIYGVKTTYSLAATCGASVPESLQQELSKFGEEDREAVAVFGIDFAVRQCRELLAAGVPGILLYTMDRWEATAAVINRLREERLI